MKITSVEPTKLDGISLVSVDHYNQMPYWTKHAEVGREFDFWYIPNIYSSEFVDLIRTPSDSCQNQR